MNSYGTEVTSNPTTTENTRTSLRRIARHDEPVFSNASILNSMEKFVRTVNDMEETILIPSRLLDLAVGDNTDKVCDKVKNKHGCGIRDTLAKTDLYRLYTIVTQMKTDLLWSQQSPVSHDDQTEIRQSSINKQREQTAASPSPVAQQQSAAPSESGSNPANGETNAAAATTQHRSHERCPSTTSIDRQPPVRLVGRVVQLELRFGVGHRRRLWPRRRGAQRPPGLPGRRELQTPPARTASQHQPHDPGGVLPHAQISVRHRWRTDVMTPSSLRFIPSSSY
ncbi:unnamed protein product [Trichogramma brassicae]|uniref:Uncharacterized protein n=1 Tax=Trichogramma brassicae TaxID=86971 RepID=A0A6H5IPH0_9HYME|nr:unnamed protein product [Trichogramma brassicae]